MANNKLNQQTMQIILKNFLSTVKRGIYVACQLHISDLINHMMFLVVMKNENLYNMF